jgi:hypothetical protein
MSHLLRGVHVACSDRQAIRILRHRLAPEGLTRAWRAQRHAMIRAMLAEHHRHQELVREWRL